MVSALASVPPDVRGGSPDVRGGLVPDVFGTLEFKFFVDDFMDGVGGVFIPGRPAHPGAPRGDSAALAAPPGLPRVIRVVTPKF